MGYIITQPMVVLVQAKANLVLAHRAMNYDKVFVIDGPQRIVGNYNKSLDVRE